MKKDFFCKNTIWALLEKTFYDTVSKSSQFMFLIREEKEN